MGRITHYPSPITHHQLPITNSIDTSLEPGTIRQDIRQSIRRFMREEWWVVQLPEQTVFINPANILSVEFNPPLTSLEGEGVLDAKSMA